MGAEVILLNLKNNQITVGELLDTPASRAVFQRRFPMVLKRPPTGAARSVTLEQLLAFAQPYLSPKKINETLEELRKA